MNNQKDSTEEMTTRKRHRMFAALGATGAAGVLVIIALIVMRSGSASGVRPVPEAPAGATAAPANGKTGLALPKNASAKNPVENVAVRSMKLAGDIQVIGNVSYDADHFAIVGPLVAGRMTRLAVGPGGKVRRG
ncbi:MAG: hypothetical protein H7X95_03635, partial [Deltaproteobacteria bacterium]|nr:hypothetical protein [Deltaproteobacteria bacterium]